MIAKLRSGGRKIKQHPLITTGIILLFALIAFTFAVYKFGWDWTGFIGGESKITITSTSKGITTAKEMQPGKTFWDWLQLLGVLAIPVVVGFGTAFFTRQQAKTSEANAETQQQEEFLRTYVDKISDLLLDKELNTNPNIHSIVRARTLAALHILNTERKAIVLPFLHDSNLLQYVKGFLYSLDLSNIDLNRIDLSQADLRETNLSGADLSWTNLSQADLRETNLSGANLRETNLSGADLVDCQGSIDG
jgi:pentapeptide repeat protein